VLYASEYDSLKTRRGKQEMSYNPAAEAERIIKEMNDDILNNPLVEKLIQYFRETSEHRHQLIRYNTKLEHFQATKQAEEQEETIPVSKIEARIKELEKNIGWDPATQKDLIVVKELKELLKK